MEWLGAQMQNLKRELESSELALYKFREQHHSLSASLEERRKIIASQLQGYSAALTQIHGEKVQTQARITVLRDMLASTPDLLALHAASITDDEAVSSLRGKYRAASEELERLSITYGEAHPQVRAAKGIKDAVLAQLKAQVTAIYEGIQGELRTHELAEKGIQAALDRVNQEGLELSLQEIDYTRLDRERTSKSELYGVVMQKAAQTDLTRALRVANARILDTAMRPNIAVSPRVRMLIVIGAICGLALGIAAALGISFLDSKVRGPADMEARGVTVIGVLPALGTNTAMPSYGRDKRRSRRLEQHDDRDLIVHLEPRSTAAECCRTIRTNITFQSADRPLRTIAVTSAMPKDGKTTVSISLATTLAQSGKRVLLIDTDLRKPRLHRTFKLAKGPGITTVLAGEATLEEVALSTDIPNLSVVQCGPLPPNPSELLHTRRFAELVEDARNRFDTVIFDSPPLGAVTDPAIISTQVDGTIVVVRSGVTTRNGVDAAFRQLHGVSARIVGVVLNGVDLTDSNYGSYYAYYRGYYEEDPQNPSAPPKSAARAS
jgi:succinoglycan biosynthesis transport protein ExoP